jgi:hypothetical protein
MNPVWLLALVTAAEPFPYYIAPCVRPAETGCQAADADLARWALEAWAKASRGKLDVTAAKTAGEARIIVLWGESTGGQYGEAEPFRLRDGRVGVRLHIRPVNRPGGDPLLRDTIVYLTVLHESGHAFGLRHTANFEDIMYSFQYGGDLGEYFARYRRKLARREDMPRHSGIAAGDLKQLEAILNP